MDKYIKICPQCGSTDIGVPKAGMDLRFTIPDHCRNCDFQGIFPEIDPSGIDRFRKEIENHKEDKFK